MHKLIHKLIDEIMNSKSILNEWRHNMIIFIFKSKDDIQNYRLHGDQTRILS